MKKDDKQKFIEIDKDILYIHQPKVSQAIKERSDFIKWKEKERMRLICQTDEFDKAYEAFKKEEQERSHTMLGMEQEAEQERSMQKSPFRLPDFEREFGFPDIDVELPRRPLLDTDRMMAELAPRRMFGYTDFVLPAFRTLVYSGSPASPSALIYPCPDLEYWGAWFENDEVSLSQQYRLWFPGGRCTGRFEIWPRLTVKGLVDIGRGGKVSVGAECGAAIVECTNEDRNHDDGGHYDPEYDTVLGGWRSVCLQPHPPIFEDIEEGLHTFLYPLYPNGVAVGFDLDCPWGAVGRFIDIGHYVQIRAENAWVQFRPSDNSRGWIHTPFPVIRLWYFNYPSNVLPVSHETIPRLP
jgi:hypothetical protein